MKSLNFLFRMPLRKIKKNKLLVVSSGKNSFEKPKIRPELKRIRNSKTILYMEKFFRVLMLKFAMKD